MKDLMGNFEGAIKDVVNGLTSTDKVNINSAIWESSLLANPITERHTLVTGVRAGNKIPIIRAGNDYDSMYNSEDDSCYMNNCSIPTEYSFKPWTMGRYNCRTEVCLRTFSNDFNTFWNMYKRATSDPLKEPDTQAFLEYLVGKVEARVKGTAWRVSYLGESDSWDNLIRGNDGFFVQASAGKGEKVEIKESEPTGEEIYKYLEAAYDAAASSLWFGNEDVVFKMTYAMASKLVAFLNTRADLSQYNCDCINPDAIVSGRRFSVEGLRVFGIPVDVHREIDGSINAIGNDKKYRALLIRRSNMLIGSASEDGLEMFDMFYDKLTRTIFLDAELYIGAAIPLDEYVYISN